MDKVEPEMKELVFPDNLTLQEFLDFWNTNFTVSIDVNTKDPKMQKWIYAHKDWFKKGGE